MTIVDVAYIHRLAEASRKALCVVGWVSNEPGAEAIRIHDVRYVSSTGNERHCVRCGDFWHYGPRLRDDPWARR